ncbi:MAG: DUF6527 family protein [Hyphomonadaceae bacterium]|nr:DUF6527 family protein [Hyphomonadaceae bacterium]
MQTPRYGHAPIAMRLVPSKDEFHDNPDPRVGDFFWIVDGVGRRRLAVNIPYGNLRGYSFSEWTIGHANHCGAQWSWDGNIDVPTLTPSLHAIGVWHGFVRAGQLVEV